jgi:uncharacterized protein YfkK (UPF0435 family)
MKKDLFWEYIKRDNPDNFWYFIRKVNERLTIIFNNKVPNKFELDDADEQLLKELYEMYCQSDLFQPEDTLSDEEINKFSDKLSVK